MENYDLERYLWEAQAHANELLDLMSHEQRSFLESVLDGALPPLVQTPPKTAYVFLAETPTARDRRLARLSEANQASLWLQARFLALQATNALQLALDVATVTRMSYRKAVRHAAQAALQAPAPPTPEALLWHKFPD